MLRVYEPLVVHPEYTGFPVSDNREKIEALVSADADSRLISLPPDPIADSYRGTPVFLTAEDVGDDFNRVSPVQDDIRSWHSFDALEEELPRTDIDLVVPKASRRRAQALRAEWANEDPDTRVFARTGSWDVNPVWWLAVDPSEDEVIESEDTDGTPRVFVRTPVLTASARVDWAHDVMKEKSKLAGVVETTGVLAQWLDDFDMNSVLELDLGGMSDVLWPDTGADLVHQWIDALDQDDREAAIAAFQQYTQRWERIMLYSRSS